MAKKGSRISGLRAPFVVTVVLSAASCGGSVEEECAAAIPKEGDPCNRPQADACTYGDCYGSPTQTAECRDGKWAVVETTCNPPPPPEMFCPSSTPASGTYCNYAGAALCEYGDCGGFPTEVAKCVDHVWSVSTGSCNPPPPPQTTCPPATPDSGTYCDYVGPECSYGDCYGIPTATAQCQNNVWEAYESTCNPPPPETCPGSMPVEGSYCDYVGPYCGYGDCYGESPLFDAQCIDHAWVVSEWSCNPPPDLDGGSMIDGGSTRDGGTD